jgi:hypothetical protein
MAGLLYTSAHFMEPEPVLPCSHEPATDLYLEPDESCSHPCFFKTDILFSQLRLVRQSDFLKSPFKAKTFVCISALFHACCMPCLIHPSLFNHPNVVFSESKNHEIPHRSGFCSIIIRSVPKYMSKESWTVEQRWSSCLKFRRCVKKLHRVKEVEYYRI